MLSEIENDYRMPSCENIAGVLVALKSQGLILSIGEETLPLQSSVVRNMDMFSRLVVNLPPELPRQGRETELEADLRVAVHRQDSNSFLSDIQQHAVNIAIIAASEISEELLLQILNMLRDSGCLLIIDESSRVSECLKVLDSHGVRTKIGSMTIFAKSDRQKTRTRKGGRRARAESLQS